MVGGLTLWSARSPEFSSVEGTWPRARSTTTESGLDRAATGATTVDDTADATAISGGWWGAEPIADCTGVLACAVEGS